MALDKVEVLVLKNMPIRLGLHYQRHSRSTSLLLSYRDAMSKTQLQMKKSIQSRTYQVELHADKIKNPSAYVLDWDNKSEAEKDGLISKWEKDMRRNAEQAAIEISAYERRFGM